MHQGPGGTRPDPQRFEEPLPLTILAGSGGRSNTSERADLERIEDYKAASLRIDGRPLIAIVLDELRCSAAFSSVRIAGPARIYEPLGLEADIVDTDGSVADNLRATLQHHPGGPIAILASDVLVRAPDLSHLRRLFDDVSPCALWCPFVRVPEDPRTLGAFGWKPKYRVRPQGEPDPVAILPGHLCIFDPQTIDLALLFQLLDLTYATRNASVGERKRTMLRKVLGSLLARDLGRLVRLRAPHRTWRVVHSGLRLAKRLRGPGIALDELEHLIGRIFRADDTPAELGFRYPLVDMLSLAKDADTVDEARELGAKI